MITPIKTKQLKQTIPNNYDIKKSWFHHCLTITCLFWYTDFIVIEIVNQIYKLGITILLILISAYKNLCQKRSIDHNNQLT